MPLIVFLGALLWFFTVPKAYAAPNTPTYSMVTISSISPTDGSAISKNTPHDARTISAHSARFAHQTLHLVGTALSIHPDGKQVKALMQNGGAFTSKSITPKGASWPAHHGNLGDQMQVFFTDIYVYQMCFANPTQNSTTDLSADCNPKVKPAVQATIQRIYAAPHPAKALLDILKEHPVPNPNVKPM